MSAERVTAIDQGGEGAMQCWCCLRCAHFVHQQAWAIEDEGKRGLTAFARDQLRDLRAEVIRRGRHHNGVLGGLLRWIERHLP